MAYGYRVSKRRFISFSRCSVIFLGTYTLYLLVGHIYFNDIKTLYDTGLKGFALLFQSSLMGFGATIFGAMFTHLGWSLIGSLESDAKVLELEDA